MNHDLPFPSAHPDDAAVYAAREADWRNGAIVYQVLVDRFAPAADLAAKAHLYPAPKRLRGWHELPEPGHYTPDTRLWSQEIDFWGGDLASTHGRLAHVQQLGADVLYLNPIHAAATNHKYDALDYLQVSPEFGTRDDFRALADAVHGHGMKLVLDGVFNHMGRGSPKFQHAERHADSPWRDWFNFGDHHPGGARSWWLHQNLPELNLENPAVRDHVYAGPESAVRSYLRDGADGWRLDVAVDIGFEFLAELTRAAHQEKPGSLVVGEITNYPKEWFPAVDAVINFTLRDIILRACDGRIPPATAMRMLHHVIADTGIEPMLKSWTMLDNHDTARLATVLPDARARQLAQVLQFTLPGAPNLYYGSELGMTGGDDPGMRAPMRWDLVCDDNPTLAWTRRLIALRKTQRALRVGDLRPVISHALLAFERHTERAQDSVVVLANPGASELTETVLVGNSRLMNGYRMLDLLAPETTPVTIHCGMLTVTLPAGGFMVLQPEVRPAGGYSPYKRVP